MLDFRANNSSQPHAIARNMLRHVGILPVQSKDRVDFPRGQGGSVMGESACQAGDMGSIPGLGRSPGVGNGNPLQYSCLGKPMDRVT